MIGLSKTKTKLTVRAKIIRADGTEEDLGVISESEQCPDTEPEKEK